MKRFHKMLALFLCAVMVFSAIPVNAVAADDASHNHTVNENAAKPLAVADGDVVKVTDADGNETGYKTLQAALDYIDGYTDGVGFTVADGEVGGKYTVTLLADCSAATMSAKNYLGSALDVTLDLNGYSIIGTSAASVLNITIGTADYPSTFTIKDSSGNNSGKITDGKQGIIFAGAQATLNFEGGTITNNHGGNTGGGIKLGGNCYFNMTGGVITGNSVTGTSSANTGLGGGIFGVYMNITGGAIYGNTASGGTGKYTGRGGGVCTDITGTVGYHYVNIGPDALIYGNVADNAGDDVMIQKNASNSSKMTFSITTENWYIDGMNGQNQTSTLTDRYSEENPVPYTDGGWSTGTKKAVGLKYVAPAVPSYTVTYTDGVDGEEIFADQTYTVDEGAATPAFVGTPAREGYTFAGWTPAVAETVTGDVTYTATWEKDVVYVARLESTGVEYETLQAAIDAATALVKETSVGDQTITLLTDIKESVAISWTALASSPSAYNLTIDLNGKTVTGNGGSVFVIGRYGSYTTKKLTVIFKDSVGTGKVTGGTGTPSGSNTYGGAIYAKDGSSYIVIEGGTWTGNTATNGGVVCAAYNNNTNYVTINGGTLTGNTATGNGGAIYGRYVFINGGTITGNTANSGGGVYVFIDAATKLEMTGGAVYGNTAATDGDDIIWRANKGLASTAYLKLIAASGMGVDGLTGWYTDDAGNRFSNDTAVEFTSYAKYTTLKTRIALKAAKVVEKFTVTYTDGVDGEELFADQSYTVEEGTATPGFEGTPTREGYTFAGWTPEVAETVTGDVTYTATWVPAAPVQKNVVEDLVTVICDSDPDRHAPVTGKWYPQHCKTTSDIVWNEELGTWTVDIRIGSLYIMYVDKLEDANNGTVHELVEDVTTVYGTLKWDAEQALWVPVEAIELHTTCRTAPTAPTHNQLKSYQIKVYGLVNGIELAYTTSMPEGSYVVGEVYGSREEGFYVDITITIENGDAFITNWIAQRAPGVDYVYDWSRTPETVTFTLVYNGDLNGTLYGHRHASNTNYDWVLSTTGRTYGVVGEAYVGEPWTVTYTDGVDGVEIFPDEVYTGVGLGQATPEFQGSTVRDGYVFKGWSPVFSDTVTGSVTYVAQWAQLQTVNLVIYRNGNTSTPYMTVPLGKVAKGDTLDLTTLNISDYYSSTYGYEFEGWYNDGGWNSYKNGNKGNTLGNEITINGWTNISCMVTDYQKVQIVIYRNGDTTTPYKVIALDTMLKGDTLDLTTLNIADYYSAPKGYVFEGWFNDGKWNQYKAGQNPTGMSEITINGWTNIICMVKDYQTVVVYGVTNGDKNTAEVIFNGTALIGENLLDYLNANVTVPEKVGYTVDKWYNWDWYGHKHTETATVNGWTNIYVNYVANTYTVTLDPNGGVFETVTFSGENAITITVTYGEPIGELPVPTKEGYTFAGWVDAAGNAVTAETVYNVAGDSVLTATWTANTYTVTLDPNGGEVESTTVTVTYGEPVGELPVPTKEGYTFAGWVDAAGNAVTAETVYNVADNSGLTATWTANTYTVTLNTDGGEVESTTVTVTYGEPVGELPVPTKEGYTFAGWVDAEGNPVTADTVYDAASDATFTATWTLNPTEPEDPTDPSEPEDPTDPSEPEDPTDPSEPEDPTDPSEPETPSEPVTPDTGDGVTLLVMAVLLISAAGILLVIADQKRRMAK